MSIGSRIKKKRLELGLTQEDLANKLGYKSKSTINKIEMDINDIPQSKVVAFADALGTTIAYLMGWEDELPSHKDYSGVTNLIRPSVKPVPILGNICAGNGVWCEDNFDGYFFIDNSVKADMCLRVKGDSMTEAGIDDGDYAFIKETYDYVNGRIYAVRINDNCDAVLKKITIQEETIILSPCNDEYEPILKRLDEVSIIGECIGTYHAI